jgi:hypothetical protein
LYLGLRYIFGQFGEISSIYLKNFNPNVSRGSTTWAFVTFDNPLAASTAMEKVNMTNTFGLYVKLAMSEQEKSVKRMTEQEKDMLIFEQQRKLEAFQKTRGIGRQEYPVDDVLGPMEGKAVLLKVFHAYISVVFSIRINTCYEIENSMYFLKCTFFARNVPKHDRNLHLLPDFNIMKKMQKLATSAHTNINLKVI